MVDTDSQILTAEQREMLQRAFLWGTINRQTPQVSDVSLESDGRRRSRVIKDAVAAGFIRDMGQDAWQGNAYEVTSEIIKTLHPQHPELFQTWSKLHEKNSHRNAYSRPWIRLEELSMPEQFAAIESDSLDWFIVSSVPYEYHAYFADEAEAILADATPAGAYNRYFAGPFPTLEAAVAAKSGKPSLCLAVSSQELRKTVEAKFAEEKLQRTFATNLIWGLVSLDVVPKDLVVGPDGKPTVDPQLVEGHSLRLSSDVNPPSCRDEVRWDANLAESIDRIKSRIEKLQATLEQLRTIDKGVAAIGGWTTFKDALEDRLRSSNG
jgi:hypothetical protein